MVTVAMLCWGAAYVPSAWMMQEIPPLLAASLRLGAAGVMVMIALVVSGRWQPRGMGVGPLIVLGLTQTTAFYGATLWGIAHDGAGLAAVLANTDALFVAMLAALLLGERLRPRQWAGILVGFAGAAIAMVPDPTSPRWSWSAAVVLAGAGAWGIGTIVAARRVRGSANPLTLAGSQMMVGAAALLVIGLIVEQPPTRISPSIAFVSLAVAALGSAVPLMLFYAALEHGPAGELSALFFLVPIVGVVSAWPLLGEAPTWSLLVGLVCVCIGLVLVMMAPRNARLVPSPADDA